MSINKKRLFQSLSGHYYQLKSVFEKTKAHKLPGSKGKLREDAVARFISLWHSSRFKSITNVFATTNMGKEFPLELDIVTHDGNSGAVWPLDSDSENSVATWEEIKMIVEVKSTLDENSFEKACTSMDKLTQFSKEESTVVPLRVLFAYKVDDDFYPFLMEKFTYSYSESLSYDAFIILDCGAFFSDGIRELRAGIGKGLSPELVKNDGPSQDRFTMEDCIESRIPEGYKSVADSSNEIILLSLAVLATYATSGNDTVQSLLAACINPDYNPIF